jgi:hypothetical protein
MRRILAPALILGLFAFTAAGMIGCGEETKTTETVKTSTPGGTDTKQIEVKDTKTGDMKTNP